MDDESIQLLKEYVDGNNDKATEIYHRYINRLIALSKTRLSNKLLPDVDPEAIANSALKSVLARAKEHQIVLRRSGDLWRVLAAFTVTKTKKRIEFFEADKRNRKHLKDGSEWINNAVQEEPTPEQVAIVLEILEMYLQRLAPRDRVILQLRLQGDSVAEIAEALKNYTDQLGESVANTQEAVIRRVIREAKQELRSMLFDE